MSNKPKTKRWTKATRAKATKAAKPKATKATVGRRVEEVLRIRLDGAEFWDVREYAREKEAEEGSAWHLGERDKPLSDGQLWRYIARADRMIAESCRAHRKKLLRRHLAQRRNLYAKAVSQGDIRAALACLDSEAKLTGLFEDEVTRAIDRLQKQIAELKVQYGNSNRSPATSGNGNGPQDPPPAGDSAACGKNPARPGADDDSGGNDARSMAGKTTAHEMDEGPTSLFPAERQEPGRGSAGAG